MGKVGEYRFALLFITIISLLIVVYFYACMPSEEVGYVIEKSTISRDDSTYECFPSLARLKKGRIITVYRESNGHVPTDYSRIVVRVSDNNGKSFSRPHILGVLDGANMLRYNCPKVQQLSDGRVLVICDAITYKPDTDSKPSYIAMWFSDDNGLTFSRIVKADIPGIMPDEIVELNNGEWLLATHQKDSQYVSRSKDGGHTWQKPVLIASKPGYKLCEASIVKLPKVQLVCYMRENSNLGRPIYKTVSLDNGHTWSEICETQMNCGHRPVAHLTNSGKVLITYRHQIGGKSPWAKNLFAYIESTESAIEPQRNKQSGIILPLDHDRSTRSDCGYTGWVEIEQQQFYAISYINDNAPAAQIRSYRFNESYF